MADVARGELLRKLRQEDKHVSQETAAHEIGVSVKSIRSWEKGGGIKWKNAKRAGEYYEVDPESLVSRGDEPEGSPLETLSASASESELAEELHRTNSELAEVRGELSEVRTELERVLSRLLHDERDREAHRNG